MKKIIILMLVLFAWDTSLLAQITQKQADEIVQEHMSKETQSYAAFAKENKQEPGITITTSAGETIELGYVCWVYYINYTDAGR